MDYLDPRKKRAHVIRLYIGYFLMAIVIGLSTLILVYLGRGYYYDGKNGLIQNGLLYLDTSPESAIIKLNGEEQRARTDARLVVPADAYDIEMTRDGYRPWRRKINLEGGKVRRITYPRLYPVELKTNVALTAGRTPDLITQSRNRQYLMMRYADRPLVFLLTDTSQSNSQQAELVLPPEVLLDPAAIGSFVAVEWADNSRFVLLRHVVGERQEYIVFDRENPAASRNVTRQFGLPGNVSVELRDRSENRVMVYDPAIGTVSWGDLGQTALEAPVLTNVLAVRGLESDKLLYITPSAQDPAKVSFMLREGDQNYSVRDVQKSDRYLMGIGKFQGSIVVAVGSQIEGRVAVYRGLTDYLRANTDKTYPVPTTVLRVDKPEYVSFSEDAGVVAVYGGLEFASHEFEADRSYSFTLDTLPDTTTELRWMDSARLNYVSEGFVYSVDFDGSNVEKLVAGTSALGVYFDQDYNNLLSFVVNPEGTLFQATSTSLKL